MPSAIIIHGGIKEFENISGFEQDCQDSLRDIVGRGYEALITDGARAAVLAAVTALEDCELFNAGTGSRVQSDGEIRMSASLMDATNNRFSGVINIQYVKNPVLVAAELASEKNTVLAGYPATRYARGKGFRSHNPYTERRWLEHLEGRQGLAGTVGAVALDEQGRMFAATSTGGVGGEIPGRVSDSATVAGNYASTAAAISCTGAGEEIVNLGVAARITTRRLDGQTLEQSVRNTIREGMEFDYTFGLIAVDQAGSTIADQTRGQTLFASADARGVTVFGSL